MKKSMVFFALLAISFYSKAQISKGVMMIGVNFNTNSSSWKNPTVDTLSNSTYLNTNKYSSFSGTLWAGKFVSDNLLFGVFGGYNRSQSQYVRDQSNPGSALFGKLELTSNTYSGGLFLRAYKMLGKSHFAIYGQMSAGCGFGKSNTNNSNYLTSFYGFSDANIFSINAIVNPGIVYFFGKHFAIDASFGNVGANFTKIKYDGGNSTRRESTSFGFNSNFNLNLSSIALGVNFYFGGSPATKETTTK
jgi:hypothetical protein